MTDAAYEPRVAVVGTGVMGRGIAQAAAAAGLRVTLIGRSDESVARAMRPLKVVLGKKADLASSATTLDAAAGADAVIEAVPEDLALKREIFAELGRVSAPETLLATNTSSLTVAEIARGLPRPERVIGLHFMNPAPMMKLVELVRAEAASPEALAQGRSLVERMGKTVVEVADRPCFAVNRVLIPMINEAAMALDEGVADAESIDTALKLGANLPMGPLHLADLIGLDVIAEELAALGRTPASALAGLVAEGRLGRKTGAGFFRYRAASS